MKNYTFQICPFATQTGHISAPDNVELTPEYIRENWDKVRLDDAELDHCGCDIDDIEEEEE